MARRLYYGGSFDPIGLHHLILARLAMEKGGYNELVFIPCYDAPHKNGLTPFEHRAEMVRLAACWLGSKMHVSYIEQDLFQKYGRKSYTLETVLALKSGGEKEVHLLVGSDSMNQIHTWHGFEQLINEAKFVVAYRGYNTPGDVFPPPREAVAVIKRSNSELLLKDLPQIDVSSTLIRERVAKGLSIREFVPRGVEEYISQHGLYRGE